MKIRLTREEAKRLATLTAAAALRGICVYETEDDRGRPLLVATRWALTRHFEALDQLDAFLETTTGQSFE